MKYLKSTSEVNLPFKASQIFKINFIDGYINILLNCGTFYSFNRDYKIVNKFKFPLPESKLLSKNSKHLKKLVDFNERYFLIVRDDNISVFDLHQKKKIMDINDDVSDFFKMKQITCSLLTRDGIVIGTELGRVFKISFKKELENTYLRFQENIEYLTQDKNNIFVASYDGQFRIFSKLNHALIFDKKVGTFRNPITYVKADSLSEILIGFKDGSILMYNFYTQEQSIKRLTSSAIEEIEIIEGHIFLTDSFNAGGHIFNLETNHSAYNVFNNNLNFIHKTTNGFLIIRDQSLDIFKETHLEEQLAAKLTTNVESSTSIKELDFLLKNNFFIKNAYDIEEEFNKMKEIDKERAAKLLLMGHVNAALSVMSKYEHIHEMKAFITSFENGPDTISMFKKIFQNKNYPVCYEMVKKFQYLTYSKEFIALENNFKKVFSIIYKNKLVNDDIETVKSILAPYKHVPEKKRYINFIINNYKDLGSFNSAISKNQHIVIEALIKKNEFFKTFDSYIEYEKRNELKFLNIFSSKNVEDDLNDLRQISKYKERVVEIKKEYLEYCYFRDQLARQANIKEINENNFFIINSDEYNLLMTNFDKIVAKLKRQLSKLTKTHISKYLEDFKGEYFELVKISLLVSTYQRDIMLFLKERPNDIITLSKLNSIIELYIFYIGLDQFITDLTSNYNVSYSQSLERPKISFKEMPFKIV